MKLIFSALALWIIFPACQPERRTFDLTTLPPDWIYLTKTDSGNVIFNSCDGGNSLVTITRVQDSLGLFFHGEQEDLAFKVLSSSIGNGDTVVIQTSGPGASPPQIFTFLWTDIEKGLGLWNQRTYVASNHKADYKDIYQPCSECWEDCDDPPKDIKNPDGQ